MSKSRPRIIKSYLVVPSARPIGVATVHAGPDDRLSRAEGAAVVAQVAVGQAAVTTRDIDLARPVRAEEAIARAEALEARAQQLMADAEEAAAAKLAAAARQVNEMLNRAAEGAVQIAEQAREEGAREGWEAGFQEGLTAARSDAEAIRAAALAERTAILERSRHEIVDLALVIARHVLKAELSVKPEAVLSMVEGALARMKGEENPTVRVSPAALEAVQQAYGRLLQSLPGARTIEVVADEALSDGDFVVQGEHGFTNGRVERQVEAVEAALRKELE